MVQEGCGADTPECVEMQVQARVVTAAGTVLRTQAGSQACRIHVLGLPGVQWSLLGDAVYWQDRHEHSLVCTSHV